MIIKKLSFYYQRILKSLITFGETIYNSICLTFFINKLLLLLKKVDYYQPCHNLAIINKVPSRNCIDRAEAIYHQMLQIEKKKILDVGCSLGFFSFFFSERGYHVHGIDYDKKNIQVCEFLKFIIKDKKQIKFSAEEFSIDFLKKLPDQYDIALLLSVLHHTCCAKGLSYVQDLMALLLEKIPIVFVELALNTEKTPMVWVNKLPANELAIFDKCTNITIEKLGYYETHLSAVRRPIYKIEKKRINQQQLIK